MCHIKGERTKQFAQVEHARTEQGGQGGARRDQTGKMHARASQSPK